MITSVTSVMQNISLRHPITKFTKSILGDSKKLVSTVDNPSQIVPPTKSTSPCTQKRSLTSADGAATKGDISSVVLLTKIIKVP